MEVVIDFLQENAVLVLAVLGICIAFELLVRILLALKKQGNRGHDFSKNKEGYIKVLGKDVPAATMILDAATHTPLYISENSERITGLSIDSLYTDINILQTLFAHDEARALNEKIKDWDEKEPLTYDIAFTHHATNQPRWCRFTVIKAEGGKYFLINFEDRTDVHEHEQELKKELAQAQMVDESKTIFLSKMSHEIRTPMNGMLGMISLAKISAAAGNNEEAADYLNRAESLSKFLLSIINDILDMTRIESGKLELEKAPFNIGDMLGKIRSMFETTITEKGIHFVVESDDFSNITVLGDELRLTQIVSNLLSNSSKFTPEGGTISVVFRSMDQRDGKLSLMMRVKDTGKGMNAEFLHRLFRPFEQEDAGIARRYGGSGLGMSISDSLVHLMGGQILVNSEEGKGTEFSVFVELELTSEKTNKQIEDSRPQIDITGRRLLMAEDNSVNTMVAVRLLKHRGLEVETAVNGIECIKQFTSHEPGYYDAILMDIHMPEMDGWEATKEIRKLDREDGKTIPIFALSADAFVEDRRHSIEVGMNGHIAKPIDYSELERTLKETLSKTQEERK